MNGSEDLFVSSHGIRIHNFIWAPISSAKTLPTPWNTSRGVDSHSSSEETDPLQWNLKTYYCVYKILSLVPFLGQTAPVHILHPYILILISSSHLHLGCPWSFSFRIFQQHFCISSSLSLFLVMFFM
jgi:hypothetical protein